MKCRDLLFLETDDSCAICGIRGLEKLTVHHIDDDASNNEYDNMIVLCHNCHHQQHQGKGLETSRIEERKRHLITKTLGQPGLNCLKIGVRNNGGFVAMPLLVLHMVELQYVRQEETQMDYTSAGGVTVPDATVFYSVTQKGERLFRKWFHDSQCTREERMPGSQ